MSMAHLFILEVDGETLQGFPPVDYTTRESFSYWGGH